MNFSQSTVILNRTVKHEEVNHLKLYSYNEAQINAMIMPESIKTSKGVDKKKKPNFLGDDKTYRTVKTKNVANQCKYNLDSKDKFNFMKELEMDSVHKSNLHDSKSSLDRSHIIKVYEELADIKHQYSKQQNEMKVNILQFNYSRA